MDHLVEKTIKGARQAGNSQFLVTGWAAAVGNLTSVCFVVGENITIELQNPADMIKALQSRSVGLAVEPHHWPMSL